MPAVGIVLVLAAAGLLGSIPFGLLIARRWTGADVRRIGSGNIGATNVLRASGPFPAILTLLLDVGKGAGAVLIARAALAAAGVDAGKSEPLFGPQGAAEWVAASTLDDWAALAAVAGHMYSPWLGFAGGKGVATAAGALLVLSPALAGIGFGIFAVLFVLTRIVSLGSICACALMPLVSGSGLLRDAPAPPVVLAICGLILVRHRANIARLFRGTEPRLGARTGSGTRERIADGGSGRSTGGNQHGE